MLTWSVRNLKIFEAFAQQVIKIQHFPIIHFLWEQL